MLIKKFRLLLPVLGAMALTACATTAVIPDSLKVCQRPERPAVEGLTVGEALAFSEQQEAAMNVCQQQLTEVSNLIEQ